VKIYFCFYIKRSTISSRCNLDHQHKIGQYETGECVRSGFCNFMHLKPISSTLRRDLYGRHGSARYSGTMTPVIGGGVGPGKQGSRDDFGDRRRRSRSPRRDRLTILSTIIVLKGFAE